MYSIYSVICIHIYMYMERERQGERERCYQIVPILYIYLDS